MKNDILDRIEGMWSKLSKGQRQIAQYISDHYDKAAFMTASRLGTTVNVSESTVVRFATELGYEGYPEMQQALQEMIRSRLTSVQRIEVTNDRMVGQDILRTVMHSDIDNIRNTLDKIDRQDFGEVVSSILGAGRIYILGVRSSSALSSFLGFYLNLIFENVHLVSTNSISEMFEQILRVGPGDAVIGISFPRYSRRTVKAMQFAADRGADVIAITDGPASPMVPHAKHKLFARSDMASFVDSLVAPLSLINALIVALTSAKRAEVSATFESLENIWKEYEVYEVREDESRGS